MIVARSSGVAATPRPRPGRSGPGRSAPTTDARRRAGRSGVVQHARWVRGRRARRGPSGTARGTPRPRRWRPWRRSGRPGTAPARATTSCRSTPGVAPRNMHGEVDPVELGDVAHHQHDAVAAADARARPGRRPPGRPARRARRRSGSPRRRRPPSIAAPPVGRAPRRSRRNSVGTVRPSTRSCDLGVRSSRCPPRSRRLEA